MTEYGPTDQGLVVTIDLERVTSIAAPRFQFVEPAVERHVHACFGSTARRVVFLDTEGGR